MSDLINRQAAIDKIDCLYRDTAKNESYMITGYNHAVSDALAIIKSFPSAEVRTQMSSADCISRQAAIDALCKACANDDDYDECLERRPSSTFCDEIVALRKLPSSQPEIIQCYECKWFQCNMRMDGYVPKGVDAFECRHWCGSCDPVDFCSYAERREE